MMVFNKTHTNGHGAPQQRDCGKMDSWANFTNEDSGRRLKADVGNEEDEVGNILRPGC
jgi:hypothetical protein